MPLIPFSTKTEPDKGYSGERCLNVFARATDGVSEAVLLGRGGANVIADVGGPVRQLEAFNGALYAVADGKLQKVSGSTVTEVGEVGFGEQVHMTHNASQIALIVGNIYHVSDGVTVKTYGTGSIEKPKDLAYLDGFIVVIGEGQGRKDLVTVSSLDDATTFAGLDFASAEDSPDALVGVAVNGSRLLLFGQKTTEEWYNSGDADFPLAPSGRVLEVGLYDARTLAKEDNGVFFLADDKIAHRTSGGVPPVISTRGIEDRLAEGSPHSAMTFTERGHKFYALRMSDGTTLTYDLTNRLWHERSTGTEGQPWFCTCSTMLNGVQYFGTDTGKIITLDRSTFDDDGQTVVAEGVSRPIYEPDGLRLGRVHLLFEGGDFDIGRTPKVMLDTSRDGHNWKPRPDRNLPKLGEHGKPVEWHGLGYFPSRAQVRWRITDPVPRDCYGGQYELG